MYSWVLLLFHKTNPYPPDLLSPDSRSRRVGRPRKILVEAAKTDSSQALGPQSQSVISCLLIIVSRLFARAGLKRFLFQCWVDRRGTWEWLAIRQSPASHLCQCPQSQGHHKGNGPPMQHTHHHSGISDTEAPALLSSDLRSQVGKFFNLRYFLPRPAQAPGSGWDPLMAG